MGCCTVVSGGRVYDDRYRSSNPTTERSSGTFRPRSRAARKAPRACMSLKQNTAVGGSASATSRLLALADPPTAVFCFNDMQALGALRAARERGLNVPDDLSVVGLDDLYLSSYTLPPLTTVQQPMHEMGRLAAQILLELLSGKNPDSRITLSGKLVVRESTASPRVVKEH